MKKHGNTGNKNRNLTPEGSTVNINMRCTVERRERYKAAAAKEGLSMAQWIYKTLDKST